MRHWLQNWAAGGGLRSTRGLLAKAKEMPNKTVGRGWKWAWEIIRSKKKNGRPCFIVTKHLANLSPAATQEWQSCLIKWWTWLRRPPGRMLKVPVGLLQVHMARPRQSEKLRRLFHLQQETRWREETEMSGLQKMILFSFQSFQVSKRDCVKRGFGEMFKQRLWITNLFCNTASDGLKGPHKTAPRDLKTCANHYLLRPHQTKTHLLEIHADPVAWSEKSLSS